MKKIFAVVLILLISASSFAQDSGGSDSKFRFGFKVAPSLAWMKPDVKSFESDGSRVAFIYGLMMDIRIAKNYAFATGLEISYRGGEIKYDYPYNSSNNNPHTYSGNDKYNMKYLEIPLTIKMKTNEIGYITYFGQFGFQPAIKISAKEDYTQTKTSSSPPKTFTESDVNADVSGINVSLFFALGLEYRISGNTAVTAGFQFSNGFTDVLTGTNHDDNSVELKSISNYFSLNVGVFF